MKKVKFTLGMFLLVVSMYGLYANGSSEKGSVYEGAIGYVVENGTAIITDYAGSDENLIIPETLRGYTVVSIGEEAFKDYRSLTSIEIPDSIISIGDHAFQGCTSLTLIEIPNSVTNIGVGAFFACNSLTTATIPNSVISIGSVAFMGCTSLTSIEIPNSVTNIGHDAFFGTTLTMTVAEGSYAQEYALKNNLDFGNEFDYKARNGKLTIIGYAGSDGNLIIPQKLVGNTVVSIGDLAFSGYESLISIEIPDSVTSIGDEAFSGCTSLTSVEISDSVRHIGEGTFKGCDNLIVTIAEGSYAHEYALENNIDFVLE